MDLKLDLVRSNAINALNSYNTERQLNEGKPLVFGRNGTLTELLRSLKDVPADQKPAIGKAINDLRVELEQLYDEKQKQLHTQELNAALANEKIDITIDKSTRSVGAIHPLNKIRDKLNEYFISNGYIAFDSPEIDTDYYNFKALNIPDDHPARDMQDTFFITNNFLLRSQTSTGQIHLMENHTPPIKMICSGRVYRSDDDATHSPVFHQMEGLVVDKKITLCDLKSTLSDFAKFIFGSDTKIRFRSSYFPFTEPSVEVDVSCPFCKGKGCRLCKNTGWIEILGSGIVNRNVLSTCGINPDEYSGFAFGMGLERIAIIMYGINDIKVFWENDLRFLRQYGLEDL